MYELLWINKVISSWQWKHIMNLSSGLHWADGISVLLTEGHRLVSGWVQWLSAMSSIRTDHGPVILRYLPPGVQRPRQRAFSVAFMRMKRARACCKIYWIKAKQTQADMHGNILLQRLGPGLIRSSFVFGR